MINMCYTIKVRILYKATLVSVSQNEQSPSIILINNSKKRTLHKQIIKILLAEIFL